MHFEVDIRSENAGFILEFSSQASDLKTSVFSKQVSLVKKLFLQYLDKRRILWHNKINKQDRQQVVKME